VSDNIEQNELIVSNVDFSISTSSRIAIVGRNGTGKSTIFKLLNSELNPLSGTLYQNAHLHLATYSQHSTHHLELEMTPVEYLISKFPELKYQDARKYLGTIGIPGHIHENKIKTLSGGQKSRVVFVELQLTKSNIMLLDEPTNHLDMETIDGLIEGLKKYDGGLVVITHNIDLISEICNEIWICEESTIRKFPGDIGDYIRDLLKTMYEEELLE
jgi:ATPase subunit of ABC transporter with duplicated ATPase domains